VAWIQARIVYENDEFVYEYGMGNTLAHVPARARGKEPGGFKAAYCIAKFKTTGEFQFEVMYRDEIETVRKRARGGDSGAWVSDWEAMALKTVIRRLCKFLPLNPEHQSYVAKDEYAEAGVLEEYIDADGVVVEEPQAPMDPLDSLAEDLEKSTFIPSPSQSTISLDETPEEEPGSTMEEKSKTGSDTSENSTPNMQEGTGEEAPPMGGEVSGEQPDHANELPFDDGEERKGRITKNEDANYVAAIANLKEKMRKLRPSVNHDTVVARICGTYGAERPIEIRSRIDREKFWKELNGIVLEWEVEDERGKRVD
jgi:recombinational DNA repair protein RecT